MASSYPYLPDGCCGRCCCHVGVVVVVPWKNDDDGDAVEAWTKKNGDSAAIQHGRRRRRRRRREQELAGQGSPPPPSLVIISRAVKNKDAAAATTATAAANDGGNLQQRRRFLCRWIAHASSSSGSGCCGAEDDDARLWDIWNVNEEEEAENETSIDAYGGGSVSMSLLLLAYDEAVELILIPSASATTTTTTPQRARNGTHDDDLFTKIMHPAQQPPQQHSWTTATVAINNNKSSKAPFLPSLLSSQCRFCRPNDDDDETGGGGGTIKRGQQHSHMWIQRKRLTRTSPAATSMPHHHHPAAATTTILPLFSPTIVPLQSLRISLEEDGATITTTTTKALSSCVSEYDDDTNNNTLLLACWKRQLAGTVIMKNEHVTSRLRFLHPSRDKSKSQQQNAYRYGVVESVTAMYHQQQQQYPSTTTESCPSYYYKILPSTRITIISKSNNNNKTDDSCCLHENIKPSVLHHPYMSRPSPSPPSLAAQRLAEALQHIQQGREQGRGGAIPRTFLLSGPPGTGKTYAVTWAMKQQSQQQQLQNGGAVTTTPTTTVQLCSLRGSELLQSADNPAQALQREFQRIATLTKTTSTTTSNNNTPSATAGLIFLDECDALVGNSDATTNNKDDAVSAMLAQLMDRVAHHLPRHGHDDDDNDWNWNHLVVVGATNRVDSLPASLRRRFEVELPMTPPTVAERATILEGLLLPLQQQQQQLSRNTTGWDHLAAAAVGGISKDELHQIAELCVGFVPADLAALVRQSWLLSLQEDNDAAENGGSTCITLQHLEQAVLMVGSSALRDATALAATPPSTSWHDIAGDPGGAKTALRQSMEWPRTRATQFRQLGLQPPRGILLYGPPGCAKTTLARAAAGASGIAFLSLSPAQVYASSYVGEAEAVIRRAFTLARSAAPCILFLDEIDSIFDSTGGSNGSGSSSSRGSSAEARVLSTFLNEMDGVDSAVGKDGVLVLGATNRPWTLDAALLRPGRLGDKIIYLPPPDRDARLAIFKMQFASSPLSEMEEDSGGFDWNWDALLDLSEGMTGAEVVGACQEAKMHWLRDNLLGPHDGAMMDFCVDGGNGASDLQKHVLKTMSAVKPLLSDPAALEPFRIFAKGKPGTM